MKPLSRILTLAWLALSLAACSQMKQSSNRFEEDQLRLAGFKMMQANNADRQQMFNSLPADTITRIQREDDAYYSIFKFFHGSKGIDIHCRCAVGSCHGRPILQ